MGQQTDIVASTHGKPIRGVYGAQACALCWTIRDGKLRLLMITSRTTRRWIMPKGWVEPDMADDALAAQEAWEEAGVRGKVKGKRIGRYKYIKQDVGPGKDLPCRVDVYPLRVRDLAKDWPERSQRQRRWMSRRKAAKAVWEPELAQLIRQFTPKVQ